ncbi:lipocalin family protein [Carboxylicivirga sp. N1Y90]|uniref:lipocalin family protein n=1 Tax=Carboxylicivirga fragile TaxID=3417571 RepID=UPI003D3536EB|nr:lipocalin family protein [Marinilabiliaceae bacterium N1Y90]
MGKNIGLGLVMVFLFTACNGQESMIDKTVVKELDINRYLGTWYEIARYDHRFERDMVGVTANYSFRADGKLKVINSGYKGSLNGERSEAIGKAKIPNPTIPSKLKVSFFWIFYGDYFVLDLDKDYQWALIGSSSDKYLWILSRTPIIEDSLYEELLDKLVKRGYDVNQLIKVEQFKDEVIKNTSQR